MHDIYGEEMEKWTHVEDQVRACLDVLGYREFRTPVLENVEVFSRSVGDETDIVEKQMYTLMAGGGEPEKLVLRPEETAAFIRAVIEHQLHKKGHPQRYYYYLPMFRYERPQKGRQRQFHQFGAEFILDPSPEADAEIIAISDLIFSQLGISEYEVRVNSVGCNDCRPLYKEVLKDFFRPYLPQMCEECRKRFDRSPLRLLDCKKETCKEIAKKAPLILQHLCVNCREHHEGVKGALTALKVKFREDPYIVRGLDYYSRTAFEVTSPLLGSQDALGGGGRYDLLAERFGEKAFSAVGVAFGMERIMLALEAKHFSPPKRTTDFFFVAMGKSAFDALFPLSFDLKRRGISVEMSYEKEKSVKSQFKHADRAGARFTVIIGDNELKESVAVIKDMQTRTQENIPLSGIQEELIRRIQSA
jgi:histidyl-tRNA synthetase